ncbi:DNA-binding GntR family transcriptional regulator [Roseinatronobacter thiooxidans]|uniref:DNA-binding GntR family transcriptional regulator n=1 Tax=Roseinatronobacter thiooxidans TaxID=121821 RepID=A0A2W7PXX4_9RHOB|nr:GntR family transcriptional regulator [Roseinatronobacter thiooxidans]PZX36767.1 DNA-binding GntR family transcriptional regulator [Roseinatronobacter thiooxidans]
MIELSREEARLISAPMSRKDIVLGLIRSAIVDGRLSAGQKLDQNEIATSLGVSRMPVREALKHLQAEGLVVVYPYRGVEVARLDPADIRELFAIRGALEKLAIGKAMEALCHEDFLEMDTVLKAMDRLVDDTGSSDEWAVLNRRFHERINAACNWPRLLESIDQFRANVERYVRLYISVRGKEQSQREHWAILEACRTGDIATAQDIIEAHSRNTAEYLIKAIESADSSELRGTPPPSAGKMLHGRA